METNGHTTVYIASPADIHVRGEGTRDERLRLSAGEARFDKELAESLAQDLSLTCLVSM